MVNFLNADKTLSPDGLRLVEWLTAQCNHVDSLPLEENVNYLNTLSGPIRQYYINVHSNVRSHSAQAWIEDFSKSWAKDCWRIMEYVEAEQQKANAIQENAEQTNAIATELAALKESVAEMVANLTRENSELKAENEALKAAAKPAKSGKKSEPEAPEGEVAPEPEA